MSYEAAFRRHVQQHGPLPVPPPPESVKLEITTQEQVAHSPTPRSEISVSKGFSIWQAILAAVVFGLIAHAYRRASRPSSLCFPVEDLLNSARETENIHAVLVVQSDKHANCFPQGTLLRLLEFRDADLRAAHSIGALTPQSLGLRDPTDSQLIAKLPGVLTKLHNARDIARDMELDLETKRKAVQKSLKKQRCCRSAGTQGRQCRARGHCQILRGVQGQQGMLQPLGQRVERDHVWRSSFGASNLEIDCLRKLFEAP